MTNNAKAWLTGTPENPVINLDLPSGPRGEKGEKGDKGDIGNTPNVSIGEVITMPNPGDDLWMADILRSGTASQAAIRESMPATFRGDKGDVGDPLKLTPAGTIDLNALLTSAALDVGIANSTLERNYPVAGIAGALFSYERNNSGLQEFWPTSSASRGTLFYRRIRVNSVWQPWYTFTSLRTDNTSGRAIYTWDETTNREQLIYGDTGERNISADLLEVTSGTVYLRRVGNIVYVTMVRLIPAVAKSTHVIANLPAGFRSTIGRLERVTSNTSSINFILNQSLTGYDTKVADSYSSTFIYPTNDPWPTTLPGVAA